MTLIPGRFFCVLFFMAAGVLVTARLCFSQEVDERLVRVALLKDAVEVRISIRGHYQIADLATKQLISEKRRLPAVDVIPTARGIMIGDQEFPERIRFYADKDIALHVNGTSRRYRNIIDIIKTPNQKLLVINVLPLEEYIRGILYHETPHRWPLEALKVQAVAARTYALYRMKTDAKQLFDVTNDIYSQVYGGRNSERYRANIAVERTQGEVLVYDGEILPAYFSATCGGHTEDVSELWNQDLAPLKGVVCDFCKISPHYRWKKNFRSKDVQETLVSKGRSTGLIKDIAVIERNASGRIRTLEITSRDEKKTRISGKDFRQIIGPNVLKSNLYDIEMKGYYFDALGKGWGHGVGMCQWGTLGMVKKGYKYDEILLYYYPGVKIVDERTILNPPRRY